MMQVRDCLVNVAVVANLYGDFVEVGGEGVATVLLRSVRGDRELARARNYVWFSHELLDEQGITRVRRGTLA
jgi:hypothetical protein